MIRRIGWLLLVLLLTAWPAAAQERVSGEDWIPAHFAGFVRLNMDDPNMTLTTLNAALRAVASIQPARFDEQPQNLGFEAFLPLGLLFDVEDASFEQDVAPWLAGDIVIAYDQFEAPLSSDESNMLMIVPTSNAFMAASRLSRIIEGQQLGETDSYRGVTLYIGDKSTIAVTPEVVLVGATELVKAALDLDAGEGERLTAQPAYQAIQSAIPADTVVFGYMPGSSVGGVLSALLNIESTPDPLLEIAGQALGDLRGQDSLEARLLTGNLSSAAFVLHPLKFRPVMLEASVIVNTETIPADDSAPELDASMLDLIPRNAMIVHQGADVRAAFYDLLVALPLSNYGGRVLGAFPLDQSLGVRSGLVQDPTAEEMHAAINNFLGTLKNLANFDLEADFLDHLEGNYTIALLSNPNRPVAFLNTPFDTIIVADTNNGEAALAGATRLVEMFLGVQDLPTEQVGDYTFTSVRLSGSGDAVLRLGVVNNRLVIVTGDALEQALAALGGDNRLTEEPRWQLFTQDNAPSPELYVDVNAYYNTFIPSAGGFSLAQSLFRGFVANTERVGDGLFSIDLRMNLPG